MNDDWAAEHLQTIRTLMERAALYRRALAPIATYAGAMGILGGIAGAKIKIDRRTAPLGACRARRVGSDAEPLVGREGRSGPCSEFQDRHAS